MRLAADRHAALNAAAMQGGGYRLRVGDLRVIYAMDGDKHFFMVLQLGHIGDVHR